MSTRADRTAAQGARAALSLCVVISVCAALAAASAPAPPDVSPSPREARQRPANRPADAFSHPVRSLPAADLPRFKAGAELFKQVWVASPAPEWAEPFDGLGPLFNAKSCELCHVRNGRGHPPRGNWPESDALSMVLRLSIAEERNGAVLRRPEPVYGMQLQDLAIEGHTAEGKIHVTYEEFEVVLGDGERVSLRKPTYGIAHPAYGPMEPNTTVSPRIAPPMIGLGLLEAIPDDAILARARDARGDEISGRPNFVRDANGAVRLGRFGWKAEIATLAEQTAEAFANDIGISSPLAARPSGDCTSAQQACLAAPNGNTPLGTGAEISSEAFDAVVFHVQALAVPPRQGRRSPQARQGQRLFSAIGCASCHTPSHRTGTAPPGGPHLANQTIWPYTDLLLHDMGEGLADRGPDSDTGRREWRTPPLWGIGRTASVSGHTYFLHDGRARNLLEAVLWHGGEAEGARQRFAALSLRERKALIAFLKSL